MKNTIENKLSNPKYIAFFAMGMMALQAGAMMGAAKIELSTPHQTELISEMADFNPQERTRISKIVPEISKLTYGEEPKVEREIREIKKDRYRL